MNPTCTTSERLPLTGNFHFIKSCNYQCGFCYATFADIQGRPALPAEPLLELTRLLAQRYTKVTFVGGEPTLYPGLPEMLEVAKAEGALTNVVTNGSRVNATWLEDQAGILDFLTLSIDSTDPRTLRAIGRHSRDGEVLSGTHFARLAGAAQRVDMGLKVNTVVTTVNQAEDMSAFIAELKPERWKILQAAPVSGQNDEQIHALTPTLGAFEEYVDRHVSRLANAGIRIVAEPINVIRGSYVMVDPQGRFFDSTSGAHDYSSPILAVGLDAAFSQVSFDAQKFISRGGDADWTEAPRARIAG